MSYEPRSLNPSIMEKRINDLEKASGGGGFEIAYSFCRDAWLHQDTR